MSAFNFLDVSLFSDESVGDLFLVEDINTAETETDEGGCGIDLKASTDISLNNSYLDVSLCSSISFESMTISDEIQNSVPKGTLLKLIHQEKKLK